MSEGGTLKSRLEAIQKELDAEQKKWEEMQIHVGGFPHSNDSIFQVKIQVQAIVNALIASGLVKVDELNLQFKTILLNDLRSIRENLGPKIEEARSEARRAEILRGVVPGDGRIKPPWED